MYCHQDIQPERRQQPTSRSGFTLVEMLVATGLVVLIMSLFAQIYSSAVGMLTQQRAMGNNDQKARIFSNVIRNDLKYITYRQTSPELGTAVGIVPLAPGDEAIYDRENQRGYFYYSENDPLDPTDDVLQFTIEVDPQHVEEFLVGKATDIAGFVDEDEYPKQNQPSKDGGPDPDYAPGQSRFAEVSYFLRNGVLYRRVLLLRDPLSASDEQPGDGPADRWYGPSRLNYTSTDGNSFWNDFDYSATRHPTDRFLWFNGRSSLLNVEPTPDSLPLGHPWNRFGFLNAPGNPNHGYPREYFDPVGNKFLGRFTHEETSNLNMTYPGNDAGLPWFNRDQPLNDGNNNYVVDQLEGGERFGEDILLTNVEAFDVEIWDHEQDGFVSLRSDSSLVHSFHNNQNPSYGPHPPVNSSRNNVFDTWHPSVIRDTSGTAEPPPRRPVQIIQPDFNEWSELPDPTVPPPGNFIDAETTLRVPELPQQSHPPSLYYQAIRGGARGLGPPPNLPAIPGYVVIEPDYDPDGMPDSGDEIDGVIWKCFDNRIGLRAMRITIRYVDQKSRLPKQVTILHSFTR